MSKSSTAVADQPLLRLTWPIFIELLLVFLISVVDAWFLSRVSDQAAASVGAMLPLTGLAFMIFNAVAQAGNSVASQRLGAGDHAKVSATYTVMLLLNLGIGVVAGVSFFVFAPLLTTLMGLSAEMADMAVAYIRITGTFIGILSVRFAFSAMLASRGKTQLNMWAALVMNLFNIAFNYLLVEGKLGFPALGVQGVAIASVVSWSASLLFAIWSLYRLLGIRLPFRRLKGQLVEIARPILKIAVPASLEPLSFQLSQILIVAMVVKLGDVSLAARVYVFNLLFLSILWCFGLSSGCQIKVAHLIGARRYDDAHQQLMQGLRLAIGGALLITACLRLGADVLLGVFTDNGEIILLGSLVLGVAMAGEVGRAFNVVVGSCLRASGDARFNATVGISVMWLFAVPMSWLLGLRLEYGLVGMFVAMAADEWIRGVVALLRWRSRKWVGKGVYDSPGEKASAKKQPAAA